MNFRNSIRRPSTELRPAKITRPEANNDSIILERQLIYAILYLHPKGFALDVYGFFFKFPLQTVSEQLSAVFS